MFIASIMYFVFLYFQIVSVDKLDIINHVLHCQFVVQFNLIQKLYLKMVTQKVYNLSSLGPSKHVNNTTMFHTYIQNNTCSSAKHSQTQLTLSYKNISINTNTKLIQCIYKHVHSPHSIIYESKGTIHC